MTKLLIDTDVVLDILLDRHPHVEGSAAVWAIVERRKAQGWIAAHSVTTVHYLVRRERNGAEARRTIESLLSVLDVALVDSAIIQNALRLSMVDFEDAVTAAAAQAVGCDYIVTRNTKDYTRSPIQSMMPESMVAVLSRLPGLS